MAAGFQTSGHTTSADRMQTEMDAGAQLALSFLFSSGQLRG